MNQDPTILDELSRLSQHVAALQKHTPFSIPQGYFEQFPESLKSKIRSLEIESELASISPLLDKMDRKMPFELPENYFETKQFNQPEASKQPIGKVIRFRQWFSYAAAASVLLMVMLTVLNKKESAPDLVSSSHSIKDIHQDTISPEVYSEYLTEAENTEISIVENIPQENAPTLLTEMNSSTVMELLKEIPENDIHSYMDQSGMEENSTTE